MQLFGTKGQKFHHCPGTKGQRDKLKILPRDGTGRDSQNSGRDGPGQPKSGTGHGTKRDRAEKDVQKQEIIEKKPIFSTLFLSFLSRGTSRDGTGHPVKIPARPVPWQDFELVPLSLCPGTMKELLSRCPFVPGQ